MWQLRRKKEKLQGGCGPFGFADGGLGKIHFAEKPGCEEHCDNFCDDIAEEFERAAGRRFRRGQGPECGFETEEGNGEQENGEGVACDFGRYAAASRVEVDDAQFEWSGDDDAGKKSAVGGDIAHLFIDVKPVEGRGDQEDRHTCCGSDYDLLRVRAFRPTVCEAIEESSSEKRDRNAEGPADEDVFNIMNAQVRSRDADKNNQQHKKRARDAAAGKDGNVSVESGRAHGVARWRGEFRC